MGEFTNRSIIIRVPQALRPPCIPLHLCYTYPITPKELPMTISLCDDNARERGYIRQLVLDWALRPGADFVRVREYPPAEALLFSYPDSPPDILLLDIEMPGMNGVELAKSIRARAEAAQIIFITGYPDFIAEGYEVEALHYLIKPVTREKLWEVLDRAAVKIAQSERKILVPFDGGKVALPLREIRYIEAQRQYSLMRLSAQSPYFRV